MSSIPFKFTPDQIVNVNADIRWQVYYRLKELDIKCQCLPSQPLYAEIESLPAAIQLWSVVSCFSLSRCELVDWLNCCWKINSYHPDNI